jgi:type II secretory pathway component GspD/PulD (secretin)
MRTLVVLLSVVLIATPGGDEITLSLNKAPITELFREVEKQTAYRFVYTRESLHGAAPVTITVRKEKLETLLKRVFSNQPLTYRVEDEFVFVKARAAESAAVDAFPASAASAVVVE